MGDGIGIDFSQALQRGHREKIRIGADDPFVLELVQDPDDEGRFAIAPRREKKNILAAGKIKRERLATGHVYGDFHQGFEACWKRPGHFPGQALNHRIPHIIPAPGHTSTSMRFVSCGALQRRVDGAYHESCPSKTHL